MNWLRIGLAGVTGVALAGPAAWWFWTRRQFDAGRIVALLIVTALSIGFSAVEYVDVARTRLACIQDGLERACLALAQGPDDSVKVGAYAIVGMCQVMLVFLGADAMERRSRNARVDPAWQR